MDFHFENFPCFCLPLPLCCIILLMKAVKVSCFSKSQQPTGVPVKDVFQGILAETKAGKFSNQPI